MLTENYENIINELVDSCEWETFKFSDLVENINEKVNPKTTDLDKYIGLEHLDSGSLHIRRFGDTSALDSQKLKIYKGDTIFAKRNAYLRRASVASFDAVASAHSLVLRPNKNKIIPEFFSFFMLSDYLWDKAIEISVGSLSPTINWKVLAKIEFVLPKLEFQDKLVDVLRCVDDASEASLALNEALKTLMHSKFKEMLAESKGSKKLSVKDLLLDGPKNGFSPKTNGEQRGSRTVSISSIRDGKFVISGNIKYAEVEPEVTAKFDVKSGDIFVVRGNGNRDLCGRAGIAEKDYEDLFYPDLLIRLRFDPEIILPEFAVILWNSMEFHSKLLRSAKSTNGIWKINGDDIKKHKLVVPQMNVQRDIVNEQNNLEEVLVASNLSLASTQRLSNSIVNRIFRV